MSQLIAFSEYRWPQQVFSVTGTSTQQLIPKVNLLMLEYRVAASGTPNFTLTVQQSVIDNPTTDSDWYDLIPAFTIASGNQYLLRKLNPGSRWIRTLATRTSGTLTLDAFMYGKGFA